MMKNVSAVIVAGRETRPLRAPKQLLPFGDTTVLGRTLRSYLDAGVQELILVVPSRSTELAESIGGSLGDLASRVRIVSVDGSPSEFGRQLKAGVEAVSGSAKAIAVGLGDQPLLAADLIDRLSEAFSGAKKKLLVPVSQGQIGLPFFLHPSLASKVSELAPTDDAWDLVRANADEVVDHHIYETSVVRTIDDLDDYHALLTLAGLPIPEPPAASEEKAQHGGASGSSASDGASTYHSHSLDQG